MATAGVTANHKATALKSSAYLERVTVDHIASDLKRSANIESMSNRRPKARKVILAFSIVLVVTLYLVVTTICCIFGSVEDRDGTYAQKLFNEVSFFELLYVHCIYTEIYFK